MKKKSEKLEWKIVSTILIVIFGLSVWGAVSLFWTGSSKEIESIANQFKPQSNWKLISDRVEGPKNWCGDLVCPSVSRQWKTDHALSKEEFKEILKKSKWNFAVDGSCLPNNTYGKHVTLCSAKGVIDNYRVSASVSASNPATIGESWVGIYVEENR